MQLNKENLIEANIYKCLLFPSPEHRDKKPWQTEKLFTDGWGSILTLVKGLKPYFEHGADKNPNI